MINKILTVVILGIVLTPLTAGDFRLDIGTSKIEVQNFQDDKGLSIGVGYRYDVSEYISVSLAYALNHHRSIAPYGHSYVDGDLAIISKLHSVSVSFMISPLVESKLSKYLSPYFGIGLGGFYEQFNLDPEYTFDPYDPLYASSSNAIFTFPEDADSKRFSHNRIGIDIFKEARMNLYIEQDLVYTSSMIPVPDKSPFNTLWRVGVNYRLNK